MNFVELYFLAPTLVVLGTALAVVLADSFASRKAVLLGVATGGVTLAIALNVIQWIQWRPDLVTTVFGGGFSFDGYALFFQTLILAITLIVLLIGYRYMERFGGNQGEYVALILFAVVGMSLLGAARELVGMYLAFELSALPLAALPALNRTRQGVEASLRFLLLSAVGSAILLFGIVLLYASAGSTFYTAIRASGDTTLTYAGALFVFVGLGFKMSIAPAHMWVPDVYRGAPVLVGAFLSTASKTAAFAAALGLVGLALSGSTTLAILIGILATITMFYGNLGAIRQTNLKRLIGYSTIAHAGYMLIGVAAFARWHSTDALVAVTFYLVAYAVTNLALFSVLIELVRQTKSSEIKVLKGLGRSSPFVAVVLLVGILSLLGIPPTVGFIAKLWIFGAAIQADLAWLAVAGAINSFIAAFYYLRIVRLMFVEENSRAPKLRVGKLTILTAVLLVVATLGLGILSVVVSQPLSGLIGIFGISG